MFAIPACAVSVLLCACADPRDGNGSYRCKTPPADLAACSSDADCELVALGCYCGPQPVNGVATRYAGPAHACEGEAASTCRLGCSIDSHLLAQDGRKGDSGATIAVRCDRSAGTAGTCKSYLP
jgi:hypothetical protein